MKTRFAFNIFLVPPNHSLDIRDSVTTSCASLAAIGSDTCHTCPTCASTCALSGLSDSRVISCENNQGL